MSKARELLKTWKKSDRICPDCFTGCQPGGEYCSDKQHIIELSEALAYDEKEDNDSLTAAYMSGSYDAKAEFAKKIVEALDKDIGIQKIISELDDPSQDIYAQRTGVYAKGKTEGLEQAKQILKDILCTK